MRNLFLGITTVFALGALTIPNVAMAGHHGGGYTGMSHGSFHTGSTAIRSTGNRAFVNSMAINRNVNRNFAANRNFNNRFAFNGRHHHHRNRFFFFPGFFYGDSYASYDSCYQYAWTPYGYQYVNVCGPNYYYGYY